MQSSARTVQEYLKELPADRRQAINAVRGVILANLPKGYEECMSYGMIGYVVPHSIYPKGYQCNPKVPLPFVNLGSQKNHLALHLMCCYGDPKLKSWLEKAWKDASKKFDRVVNAAAAGAHQVPFRQTPRLLRLAKCQGYGSLACGCGGI